MCFVNFILLIFLLRIGTRGTFFLVGGSAKVSIVWSILASLASSVEFGYLRHSGMLVLVTRPHLLSGMFCVVMSFLVCLVIKM